MDFDVISTGAFIEKLGVLSFVSLIRILFSSKSYTLVAISTGFVDFGFKIFEITNTISWLGGIGLDKNVNFATIVPVGTVFISFKEA